MEFLICCQTYHTFGAPGETGTLADSDLLWEEHPNLESVTTKKNKKKPTIGTTFGEKKTYSGTTKIALLLSQKKKLSNSSDHTHTHTHTKENVSSLKTESHNEHTEKNCIKKEKKNIRKRPITYYVWCSSINHNLQFNFCIFLKNQYCSYSFATSNFKSLQLCIYMSKSDDFFKK